MLALAGVNSDVRSLLKPMVSTFTKIERLVKRKATALSAEPEIANALRSYRRQGGEETENPWQVAGSIWHPTTPVSFVFFAENPLEILYARKAVNDLD